MLNRQDIRTFKKRTTKNAEYKLQNRKIRIVENYVFYYVVWCYVCTRPFNRLFLPHVIILFGIDWKKVFALCGKLERVFEFCPLKKVFFILRFKGQTIFLLCNIISSFKKP